RERNLVERGECAILDLVEEVFRGTCCRRRQATPQELYHRSVGMERADAGDFCIFDLNRAPGGIERAVQGERGSGSAAEGKCSAGDFESGLRIKAQRSGQSDAIAARGNLKLGIELAHK